MLVVIDGDTVAYRACFAAEKTVYIAEDPETGEYVKECYSAKEFDKFCDSSKVVYTRKAERRPEPKVNAIHNCKTLLEDVKVWINDKFNSDSEDNEYVVYLSGRDNYRYYLNKHIEYKGNRKSTAKPVHLQACREYLEDHWSASSKENIEADDLMTITSQSNGYENTVLVTTDKDLNQVPGWHFNFHTKEFTYISLEEAMRFFWTQMLVGDSADNIPGVRGIGVVSGRSLLETCKTQKQYQDKVHEQYILKYGEEEGHERFLETFSMLRLLRSNDEIEKMREHIPRETDYV